MFWVFNKDKVMSYIVTVFTVAVLFFTASAFNNNSEPKTVTTATNVGKLLPIYSVDTEENKVAITINCAWSADDIDSILETLKKQEVKATFFMVGDWVEKNETAVKKIYEQGNEIGNHSYSHPHVNNMSYEQNKEQIQKCSDLVKKITGKETALYRGPYGEYNNTVIKAAEDLNCKTIQWSIDSLDYKGLTGEQMWERIEPKLENGSIILMHNGTENTALSLNEIITKIKEKGYKPVTISELIYAQDYTIDNNGIQHKNLKK